MPQYDVITVNQADLSATPAGALEKWVSEGHDDYDVAEIYRYGDEGYVAVGKRVAETHDVQMSGGGYLDRIGYVEKADLNAK